MKVDTWLVRVRTVRSRAVAPWTPHPMLASWFHHTSSSLLRCTPPLPLYLSCLCCVDRYAWPPSHLSTPPLPPILPLLSLSLPLLLPSSLPLLPTLHHLRFLRPRRKRRRRRLLRLISSPSPDSNAASHGVRHTTSISPASSAMRWLSCTSTSARVLRRSLRSITLAVFDSPSPPCTPSSAH